MDKKSNLSNGIKEFEETSDKSKIEQKIERKMERKSKILKF